MSDISWADWLNDHQLAAVAVFLVLQIPLLYSVVPVVRYTLRMLLLYFLIFICSMLSVVPNVFDYRAAYWGFASFRYLSAWAGVTVEVRNSEALDSIPASYVLVSNHQSSVDCIAMAFVWPVNCAVMLKKSLAYVPGLNAAAYFAGSVFVDRFNRERSHEAIENAVHSVVSRKLRIWVFPEGTRSHSRGMLPFKKGAFNIAVKAQIPIVPVVFSSFAPFYSREKKYFHDGGKIIASVLEPVSTEGLNLDDVPALAERVRASMMVEFEKTSKEVEEQLKIHPPTSGDAN